MDTPCILNNYLHYSKKFLNNLQIFKRKTSSYSRSSICYILKVLCSLFVSWSFNFMKITCFGIRSAEAYLYSQEVILNYNVVQNVYFLCKVYLVDLDKMKWVISMLLTQNLLPRFVRSHFRDATVLYIVLFT